jgi:N,N'-diacetyllegionaminate synthase
MVKAIDISGRKVGYGYPCLIVAEAGVNHNGSPELARRLVDAAAEAGADAVKFQTFKVDRLVTRTAPKAGYQIQATDKAESQYEMLGRLELSPETYRDLMVHCQKRGILFMSSPFDEESADFLDELGVAVFKVASGEITNLPFLAHVGRKGRPIILSTGMADLGEVETAVNAIESVGNQSIILLHCVSSYPADPADVNLLAMKTMRQAFGVPVGYSDHTLGIEVALAAVALGACVIEKHFTLDRTLPGPDQQVSIEPGELASLVLGIRTVEKALGQGRKEPVDSEVDTAAVVRKSLVAAKDIPAHTTLTEDFIALKRPGTGLPPAMLSYVVGRTVRVRVKEGTVLTLEMLS